MAAEVIAGTVNWENSEEFELVATEFVCFDDNNNAVDRDPITVEFRYSRNNDILIRIGTDEFRIHPPSDELRRRRRRPGLGATREDGGTAAAIDTCLSGSVSND